jgi:hypothetical protein
MAMSEGRIRRLKSGSRGRFRAVRGAVLTLSAAVLLVVSPNPKSPLAAVEVGGPITIDSTWANADTIVVTATVTVASGAHLTIQFGTVVMYRPTTSLTVAGQLTVNGEADARVVFTSSADTIGGTPMGGDWLGVDIQQSGVAAVHHCLVRYAVTGFKVYRAVSEFHGCAVADFSSQGMAIDGYYLGSPITATITDCIIHQKSPLLVGTGVGVFIYRLVDLTMTGSLIRNCEVGLQMQGQSSYAPHFDVSSCLIRDHASRGIYALSSG